MKNVINESLATIVKLNYKTARIFERYQLDFCCKGKRTLLKACEEANVPVDEVVTILEQVLQSGTQVPNMDTYSASALVDYILGTHHNYVWMEMPVILARLQRVVAKHGQRHPEMLKVLELFADIKQELEDHLHKEERILFPRIKELEKLANEGWRNLAIDESYINEPVAIMETEHAYTGALMQEINQLTNNYTPPAEACNTYQLSLSSMQAFETDLHRHVHLENNLLFPKAIDLFEQLKRHHTFWHLA